MLKESYKSTDIQTSCGFKVTNIDKTQKYTIFFRSPQTINEYLFGNNPHENKVT